VARRSTRKARVRRRGHTDRRRFMLLIPCPWCGPRAQAEFTYGGDATLKRPSSDASETEGVAYVFLRDNPAGPPERLWQPTAGRRQWLRVRRDTRTHEILGSARPDARPVKDAW